MIGVVIVAAVIAVAYYYSLPGKLFSLPNKIWLDTSNLKQSDWESASKNKGFTASDMKNISYDTIDHMFHSAAFGLGLAFLIPLVLSKLEIAN